MLNVYPSVMPSSHFSSPWPTFNNYVGPGFINPPDFMLQQSQSQPPPIYMNDPITNSAPLMVFSHIDDDTHDCSCGDGCQCLGCASHPYNDTTKQHVHEMGVMMTFDEKSAEAATPSAPASQECNDSRDAAFDLSFSKDEETGVPNLIQNSNNTGFSPLASSQYASTGLSMHPDEYYTLEYPVGLLPNTCSDVTGSCQCGNDCCCTGCLTHSSHNGASVSAVDTSLDPLPPSASSPPGDHGARASPTTGKLMASFTVESPRFTSPQLA